MLSIRAATLDQAIRKFISKNLDVFESFDITPSDGSDSCRVHAVRGGKYHWILPADARDG